MSRFVPLACLLGLALAIRADAQEPKTVVFLAGAKSHGPGDHEYEKGLRLLASCLESSTDAGPLITEVYTDGWPDDPAVLDDADTIVVYCDGPDRDPEAHPLLRGDRLATLQRLLKRGVGLVALHYAVFVPDGAPGETFLDGIGGYFDYQGGPAPNGWYSKIQTATTTASPATVDHPILRGVRPFEVREEYYYNIRSRKDDDRVTPILQAAIPGEEGPQTVAWAVERADGGRGFGYTGGHFHANWGIDDARTLILNAILWTAGADVPAVGVASTVTAEALSAGHTTLGAGEEPAGPIRTLVITGPQHPAHDWKGTTAALREVLGADARFQVSVAEEGIEAIGDPDLPDYDLVVLNTMNWQRPGPAAEARERFARAIRDGTGLAVIHFANGAFGDWPEFRTLARRVWVDGPSSHDAFGPFRVEFTGVEHPITEGLDAFETTDELYFGQQGELPLITLAAARSKVSGAVAPMAFAHDYGSGRVFQTVLGHDADAVRKAGPLILRGSLWAARRGPKVAGPDLLRVGKFGKALDPRRAQVAAATRPEYRDRPLTVECWARLDAKSGYNILVASDPKSSSTHWEIYTNAGDGHFHAYLPGVSPAVVDSGVDVVDGAWHHLAMVDEPGRVRLFVDGRLARDAATTPGPGTAADGPLRFGSIPEHGLGCDGLVDEVRISKGVRLFDRIPDGPPAVDEATIGLWHLDEEEDRRFEDASKLHNSATAGTPPKAAKAGPSRPESLDYRAAEPGLTLTLLDRSARESFLSLRSDAEGRLFVGGREAVFVYEPDGRGGYRPRVELLRFPPHTWVTDVDVRGDDLYVMTTAALYLVRGGREARTNLRPERIIWGSPVDLHVTYHGLAWGPEGKLYFTSGDPLLNYGDFDRRPDHWGHWTVFAGPDGTPYPYNGQGGIFRCRPDGGDFEVVARGTRGSCGLAFDRRWDLFTDDNDHESRPAAYSPARLLHVAPLSDLGWPRGWMAEKTPERAELLETITPNLGREVPVGLAYYDEGAIPSLRDALLVALWGQRRVDAFPLESRGASYRASGRPFLVGEGAVRPVGVAVLPDGRLALAISYMQNNEGSPTYVSDLALVGPADASMLDRDAPYDPTAAPAERLWSELSNPSWHRRERAHQEILRRGGDLLDAAADRLAALEPSDPARNHLPWLAAASGRPEAAARLRRVATGDAAELRPQAIRALGEFRSLGTPRELFIDAIDDPDPRVVRAAVVALAGQGGPVPDALVDGPARSEDTYLRQAATFYLAEHATLDDLADLCRSTDRATRRAGVLAVARRLTVPPAIAEAPAELPLPYDVPNAMFTIPYLDEAVDLRSLGRVGSFTAAERWRLVPRTAEESRLFELLTERLDDLAEPLRLQAAAALDLLDDPATGPLIAAVRAEAAARRLARNPVRGVESAWALGPIPAAWPVAAPPEAGPIDLSAEYGPGLSWERVEVGEGFAPGGTAADVYLAFRLQAAGPERVGLRVGDGGAAKLWLNGEPVVMEGGAAVVDLQAGSNEVLIRTRPGAGRLSIRYRAPAGVTATLPERLGLATLAERLRSGGGDEVPGDFLAVDWSRAVSEGNPDRGRALFGVDGLGCARCHAIDASGASGGGPSLAGAVGRFTVAHVVESVLRPGAQVAPAFRATTIATVDGRVLSGLVVGESERAIDLLLPDATRRSIPRAEIADRTLQETSPMPAGLVRTPDELRDLLAYLFARPAAGR